MVQSERCQDLEEDETERVTDVLPDSGIFLAGLVGEIGALGKADDSLADYVRLGGARRMNRNYLDEKRTGDKGNVGNEAQDTSAPPKPEDAVIDGECEASFLLARLLSPFLLAFLALTSDCPSDALEIGRGFAIGKPSVVFCGVPPALLEEANDPVCDGARGTVVLSL